MAVVTNYFLILKDVKDMYMKDHVLYPVPVQCQYLNAERAYNGPKDNTNEWLLISETDDTFVSV